LNTIQALTQGQFLEAVEMLGRRDPHLGAITAKYGAAPFWTRPPGFATMVHIILEQQVSLASARAALDKLLALGTPLTPEGFLSHGDEVLRTSGFSRQKARYCRLLAEALLSEAFSFAALEDLDDGQAAEALLSLKGIGPWSAQIYLLVALRRPDVWPAGDLALQDSLQKTLGLPGRPKAPETLPLAEAWRPWRSVAARMLWHAYLSR
jgi:DNA-3-methyladenine glycosylase II